MDTRLDKLTDDQLDGVAGGQQLYKHEFPGAVNQITGLRPFEPALPASPDPEGGLGAYGSTNNNLPDTPPWGTLQTGDDPTLAFHAYQQRSTSEQPMGSLSNGTERGKRSVPLRFEGAAV